MFSARFHIATINSPGSEAAFVYVSVSGYAETPLPSASLLHDSPSIRRALYHFALSLTRCHSKGARALANPMVALKW